MLRRDAHKMKEYVKCNDDDEGDYSVQEEEDRIQQELARNLLELERMGSGLAQGAAG